MSETEMTTLECLAVFIKDRIFGDLMIDHEKIDQDEGYKWFDVFAEVEVDIREDIVKNLFLTETFDEELAWLSDLMEDELDTLIDHDNHDFEPISWKVERTECFNTKIIFSMHGHGGYVPDETWELNQQIGYGV